MPKLRLSKAALGCLLFLVSCLLVGQAGWAEDYATFRGDFRIFTFGDSPQLVEEKVKYLSAKAEITAFHPQTLPEVIETELLDKPVTAYFYFVENQLYQIEIEFARFYLVPYYETEIKNTLEQLVEPMLVGLYGAPTYDWNFPPSYKTRSGFFTLMAQWNLELKTVRIGVSQKNASEYSAKIYISHNELSLVKEKLDQQRNQGTVRREL